MTNVHIFSTEYLNSQEIHNDIARYFLSPSNCYISENEHLKRVVLGGDILPDWFLLNIPFSHFHGARPSNIHIQYIIVLPFDFDGPPERARILATAFFALCAQHGLAPTHMPLLNSGGGVHAIIPIPPIENSPAIAWALREVWQEYKTLFSQAEKQTGIYDIHFDSVFDPARLFSLAGTKRVKDRTFTRHYFETPPDTVERFAPLAEKIKTIACEYVPFHVRAQKQFNLPTNAECVYEEAYKALIENIYRQKKCQSLLNRDGLPDRSRAFAILIDVFLSCLRKMGKPRKLAEKIVFACRHSIHHTACGKRQLKYTYDLERQVYRLLEDFVWDREDVKEKKKERHTTVSTQEQDELTLFLHARLEYVPGASVPKELVRTAFEQSTQINLSRMQFGQLTTGKQGAYQEAVHNLQGKAVRCIRDHILLDVMLPTVEQGPELPIMKEVETFWLPVEWITPKHELIFITMTLDFSVKNMMKLQKLHVFSMIFSLARAPPFSLSMR